MTDDIIAIILWIAVVFLLLLPPSLDPAIRIKVRQVLRGEHPESPSCFGQYQGGNVQAERDCDRCPFEYKCHEKTQKDKFDRSARARHQTQRRP